MGCDRPLLYATAYILKVSIHAPRVGCDWEVAELALESLSFNSRTPCGVRPQVSKSYIRLDVFQFTHPVWGATAGLPRPDNEHLVSIHAPRVGCDLPFLCQEVVPGDVSIHAPRVGCDLPFLCQEVVPGDVSIHAPRVGCDRATSSSSIESKRFNSRTPCGVRRMPLKYHYQRWLFQFTHPVWGATHHRAVVQSASVVSIHAPRVGCDRDLTEVYAVRTVSIHAPRVGCD